MMACAADAEVSTAKTLRVINKIARNINDRYIWREKKPAITVAGLRIQFPVLLGAV
jgi:hypothetical protein